jgi:hypothetical protein
MLSHRYIHFSIQLFISIFLVLCICSGAENQDCNILHPISRIEKILNTEPVRIDMPRGARFKGDKAKRVLLVGEDEFFVYAKLKVAPQGGESINNRPRFEVAAYQLQKLFLDTTEYVVPPTSCRGFPVDILRQLEIEARPTFENTSSVFCTLQYWLNNVSQERVYDKKRFESDTVYAKHFANFNILTYLIQHSDSNEGNALISSDPLNPRVFAVDNGVSFGDMYGRRGHKWRNLRVNRLPGKTVERLRNITHDNMKQVLDVLAQYTIVAGQLLPSDIEEPFDLSEGIRRANDMIQLGLTEKEISDTYNRLQKLLKNIDAEELTLF